MKTTLRQQLEAFENGVFLESDGQKIRDALYFTIGFAKLQV